MNNGKLFIISGPSGSGKDTLLAEMFKKHPEIRFSISSVTRDMREGEEQDGKYHFISREEFETAIKNKQMLEYNVFLDNYYGTPRGPIDKAIEEDAEIVLEIDVNGMQNVKKIFPDAISVFIAPPSLITLKSRLKNRGTETMEQINSRLKVAVEEMKCACNYDYIIINDWLEEAVEELTSIIISSRLTTDKQINIINEVLENA